MRQSNGTAAKPYTLGKASANAVEACLLAQGGLTGSAQMLEGPQGYFNLFGQGKQKLEVFENLGQPFIIDSPGVCVKKYPVCSSAHAAMQAGENIYQEINSPNDIQSIYCEVTPTVLEYLKFDNPSSKLEMQFSLPYLVAVSLAYGAFDLKTHFNPNFLEDNLIKSLMSKLSYKATSGFDSEKYPEAAMVKVITKNGQEYQSLVNEASGFPGNPFAKNDYYIKFENCLNDFFDIKKINEIFEKLTKLEHLNSINELSFM